ncbi:MAG: sigma-54 dependent transcriptional regulator [Gammaproteobacteria bacterium]|nr:sigma-54 dependent transcriptional regulator [Gammaproteobacteria bacterium]
MKGCRALIVDDEPDILELLAITLGRMDIHAVSADRVETAKARLATEPFDLCLTDMRLPDGDGIELVRHIQRRHPNLPVAVITAYGNMDSAVAALKAGAFDFVSKPVDLKVLRNMVNTALRLSAEQPAPERTLIGDAPPMQVLRRTIDKLARSQAPVYISGESGSGKELVARLIHERGPRAEHPFVAVNCGAIPGELMESELFGHRKGSFTGAVSDHPGLFQAADKGTLFLDEVADLPQNMQVKLLRAIQERSIRPVGADRELPVDVRILSATHKDLDALVASGQFRQDIYYRLNVIQLEVPPLRARAADIPELARHVLHKLAKRDGVAASELSEAALARLRQYPFPGNVRELENILERAMTLCDDLIDAEDLGLGEPREPAALEEDEGKGLESLLDEVERNTIVSALRQCKGNKTAAARALGISFGALRYRLQKLGLEKHDGDE